MLACLWIKISKLGFYLGFSFLINVTSARVLADFQKVWKLLKKKMAINLKITFHAQVLQASFTVFGMPIFFLTLPRWNTFAVKLNCHSFIPFELWKICCVTWLLFFGLCLEFTSVYFPWNPSSSLRGSVLPSWLRQRLTTSSVRPPNRH